MVLPRFLKKPDGTWIDNKDWLYLNRPNYDACYQITELTEKKLLSRADVEAETPNVAPPVVQPPPLIKPKLT
jgi:hypothetical protein